MASPQGTSPLTQRELIDAYFMDHRVQVLELAAYLDRLDRAAALDGEDDFRLRATREALAVLTDGEKDRTLRAQMIFSDPRTDLLPSLDRKGALGAYDADSGES